MNTAERLEAAVRSPNPGVALRGVVAELASEGLRKPDIYALLEKLLLKLRDRKGHRQSDEDALLDVMDALVGWCHPDAQLLPEQNLT